MMPALRTEGLAKAFTLHLQGGTHIPVLGGVDLAVHPGECVALWGPSGAGKSTLMRCLYGNYGAGAGRIILRHRGRDLDLATADPRMVIEARRETLEQQLAEVHRRLEAALAPAVRGPRLSAPRRAAVTPKRPRR